MTDNLIAYLKPNDLDEIDQWIIITAVNTYGFKHNQEVHAGTFMFLDREYVKECLDQVSEDNFSYDNARRAEKLAEFLNVEDAWVDITTIADTNRKELNTKTGQTRNSELYIERVISRWKS